MSYSIDWPIGFTSQTCDRNSRFYVGRAGAEKTKDIPTERKHAVKFPNAHRIEIGSRAWQVFELIRLGGPHTTGRICTTLGISVSHVSGVAKQLSVAGVLTSRRLPGQAGMFEYSLGTKPVWEASASFRARGG